MKILLLQLKRIGDLILTTPAIGALRKNFPDARITLVVSRECAELLPAISSADRSLVANRNLKDVAVFLAVAREKFDYCVDFTQNDRSALLAFLSGARKRVASYRVKARSSNRARVYNEFTKLRLKDMHTLDYNLALLEPLGICNASRVLQLELPRPARGQHDHNRPHQIELFFDCQTPGVAQRRWLRRKKSWRPVQCEIVNLCEHLAPVRVIKERCERVLADRG